MVHLGIHLITKQLSEDSGVRENQEKETKGIKDLKMRRYSRSNRETMLSILLMAIRTSLTLSLGLLPPPLIHHLFTRGKRVHRSKGKGKKVTEEGSRKITLKSQWSKMRPMFRL